jgi:lactoylglutathione lyase
MRISALLLFLFALPVLAQEWPRPKILGLAHISLYAHDYERSKAFYRDFLGFQEPYSLKNADGSPSMTFFKINDEQFIELSPEKEPGTDRLNHYAIQTDDAEAMRKYLAAKGVKVPDHTPKGRIGNLNFMIKDPEGHSVEIVEYPPDSQTSLTRGKFMSDAEISHHLKHVGIDVTDLAAEEKFYTDVLGFSETWRGSAAGSTTLSWVNVRVPDGTDYVEFMLHKEEPAPDKRGTSHHLSLEVPSAEASIAKLNATPYRQQYTRPIEIHTGINRKRQVNLFDPDGTRTELMEPNTVDGKPATPSTLPAPTP